ncbi:MAG: hypothetical protein ABW166_11545 [Sedimenticola sp.]
MGCEKHRLPVRLNLKAGNSGTKKMVDKYGEALICVRYRYDVAREIRYKTVELIEESSPWESGATLTKKEKKPKPTDRFGVRIGYEETELRDHAKQIGGIWRPRHKLWELSYAQIEALGLQDRVIQGS